MKTQSLRGAPTIASSPRGARGFGAALVLAFAVPACARAEAPTSTTAARTASPAQSGARRVTARVVQYGAVGWGEVLGVELEGDLSGRLLPGGGLGLVAGTAGAGDVGEERVDVHDFLEAAIFTMEVMEETLSKKEHDRENELSRTSFLSGGVGEEALVQAVGMSAFLRSAPAAALASSWMTSGRPSFSLYCCRR